MYTPSHQLHQRQPAGGSPVVLFVVLMVLHGTIAVYQEKDKNLSE